MISSLTCFACSEIQLGDQDWGAPRERLDLLAVERQSRGHAPLKRFKKKMAVGTPSKNPAIPTAHVTDDSPQTSEQK